MKKSTLKKLTLSRETLQLLDKKSLDKPVGGLSVGSCVCNNDTGINCQIW